LICVGLFVESVGQMWVCGVEHKASIYLFGGEKTTPIHLKLQHSWDNNSQVVLVCGAHDFGQFAALWVCFPWTVAIQKDTYLSSDRFGGTSIVEKAEN
jgi:hypothetical protein